MAHYIQDYLYAEMPEQYVTDIIQWLELEAIYDLPPANKYHYMTVAVIPGEKGQRFFLCEKDDEGYKWVEMHFSMDDYLRLDALTKELNRRLSELDNEKTGKIKQLQDEIDDLEAQIEELNKKVINIPKDAGDYVLRVYDDERKPEFVKLEDAEEPDLKFDVVGLSTGPVSNFIKLDNTHYYGQLSSMPGQDGSAIYGPYHSNMSIYFKCKEPIYKVSFKLECEKYNIDYANYMLYLWQDDYVVSVDDKIITIELKEDVERPGVPKDYLLFYIPFTIYKD